MNAITKTIPYFSMNSVIYEYLFDKNEKRIFEPSNGGIGTRLNIASIRFINTIITKILLNDSGKK